MKCKHCNGTGTTNWCVNGTFVDCPYCGGTGEIEVMQTNEEWIQSATTEQLAEWIVRIVDCEFCPVKKPCKKQIEKWLKQLHKPFS